MQSIYVCKLACTYLSIYCHEIGNIDPWPPAWQTPFMIFLLVVATTSAYMCPLMSVAVISIHTTH